MFSIHYCSGKFYTCKKENSTIVLIVLDMDTNKTKRFGFLKLLSLDSLIINYNPFTIVRDIMFYIDHKK